MNASLFLRVPTTPGKDFGNVYSVLPMAGVQGRSLPTTGFTPLPRLEPTQPVFLDCQQELMSGGNCYEQRLARLRSWLLAAVIVAVGGWVTVGVLLAMI